MTQSSPDDDLPRWRRIMRSLEAQIDSDTLPPGARLPTEAQLASQFAVNRHTARRALEELSRNGLIRIEHGRGSFVTEDVLDYRVSSRTRFSEWIRRHNKEPSGEVLRLEEIPAEANVALALQVPVGAPVVLLERLGFADARPVSVGSHHFSSLALPGLLDALRANPAITEALASVGVLDYRRAVTRVSARMPTAAEAALLRMPRSQPLLVGENINVDGAGRVVEFGIARYPTPRVQIVFEP